MIPAWKSAIEYPAHLPVSAAKQSVLEALSKHQVLILQSETGSGKSTQIPKMVIEFLGKEKPLIALTQPRRLATKLLAQRLNQELSGGAARFVGWQVRFEKQIHAQQLIKVMTEGVLWQEILHNPMLSHYDALILDEVHERSVTMDLLLGALPALLKKRPHFKLILLSATLCRNLFQNFFKGAGFLELSGRSYPIEDLYCPLEIKESLDKVLWALDQAHELSGDVLTFCSTEAEILFLAKKLKQLRPEWEYCCLYARMLHQQQKNLFQQSAKRKVILSTNIAETSITLPGVRIVIDLGLQKILQFHPQYRVNSYPIVPISRQSITQRRGRAGRTQSGWCFHLYTQQEELQRPAALAPEIQRSSLSQVVLQVLCLRQAPVEQFPFISPPSPAQLKEAIKVLRLLELIDKRDKISAVGRQVARYPIDPRFCVILFEAMTLHCAYATAVIVAFLSGDDPRIRPAENPEKADKAHLRYHDLRSDFMSVLNLWIEVQREKEGSSKKSFQQHCAEQFLNPVALRSWDLQVTQLCELFGIKEKIMTPLSLEEDFFLIHNALLAGFFDRLYHKIPKKPGRTKHYQGSHGSVAYIHPSSVLKDAKSEWVFAIVQQHDNQGQTRLRWVGPASLLAAQKYLLPHLTYQYSNPFFAPETGEAMVYKTGHAWGLAVLPAVAELYRLLEPEKARKFICEYFIKDWSENEFINVPQWANAWKAASELTRRARRAGALLDEAQLAEKIWDQGFWPEIMVCRSSVQRYLVSLPKLSPSFFLKEDLKLRLADFPDSIQVDSFHIDIEYDDAPEAEGFLHYTIPASCWRSQQPSSWLIVHPYFGVELIEHLLHQLPKKERLQISNLRECALFFHQECPRHQSLLSALSTFLFHYYDLTCSEKSFKVYDIPNYLLPHFWIANAGNLEYLGIYQFDDDKLMQHKSALTTAAVSSPWEEIAYSAQRSIYKIYDQDSLQWRVFNKTQYWSWKALLLQQYAEKIWGHAPNHIRRPLLPIPAESLIIYRGIYLGMLKGFGDFYIIKDSDFEKVAKEPKLFTDYPLFLKEMHQEVYPAWKKLSAKKWPLAWKGLKDAMEHPLWFGHMSRELFGRWKIWLRALDVALEKAERKEKLVLEWAELWQRLCHNFGANPPDRCDPIWAIALEGIVAAFDPAQIPLVSWSEKKIMKLAEQTALWQKSPP